MNQGALHFDALLSVNNFDQGINRIKNGIREASGVAKKEAQEMDSAFRNLGTAIGGYFTAQSLFSFTKELINVRGEFQKTEIAFSTMLGSADKAKALMADMVDLAAKTPFSLKDVSLGAKQLLAFQVPAKDLLDTLTRIGNISAGVSVPIDRIILAYGQVKAAGRLMGTEMRQFTEAGIPMYAELAKVLKTDETAIKGMIEAGKVGFKDVQQVIKNLTSEGGMFFELMEKQSTSMSGRVSNLADQWDQMLNNIGQANEGIIYDSIEGLAYTVQHYKELLEIIKTLVISYGAYKAAIMVTSAAQSLTNKTLATEIGLLSVSQRWKLGRAIVTERQSKATLAEAQAEQASATAKYASLQAEISSLNVKKQSAVQSAILKKQKLDEANIALATARANQAAAATSVSSTQSEVASKRVLSAQNKVLAAEETAAAARKRALAINSQFYAAKTALEAASMQGASSAQLQAMRSEVAALALKKQSAVQSAVNARAKLAEAQAALVSARTEQAATASANATRQIENAQKKVQQAQNTVLIAQEQAIAARKTASAAATQFLTTQKELEIAATQLSSASKAVETAEEVVNIAAKNANAIATQRLTLAQMAQTVAMTTAAKAAAFLNRTLFANPYALATALIVALGYAVYKYSTALTVAEESQKRMNDDAKNQIETISSQEAKIKALTKTIQDQTVSEDTRKAALIQLNKITNGRLDQLDAEAVKTGKATQMIKVYIETLKLEAEAKRYVNELGRLDSDIEGLKNNRDGFGFGDMWDDFTDFDSKFAWNLKDRKKERVDRIVKDKEAEKKELQKKLDDLAKRGVNISETEIIEDAPSGKKGWAAKIKAQIDELESQLDSAPTQAVYNKIKAKIKALNALLNPKKEKQENQIAEILPIGSIKELQQRASLISDAIDVAVNGQVKLRKLDKYGKDKDKKGNPFLTGEVISLEESYKRREAIEIQIGKLQYKSFQERIDESERQWNNYYKMSEYYGKETADAQYKELFKGAKNYLEYLEKQEQVLRAKQTTGILTEQEKKDILFLQQKITELNGTETPFQNFKRNIDDVLKSLPSFVDQLDAIETAQNEAYKKEGGNTDFFLQQRKYLEERKREIAQQQKDIYSNFIKEQETFEQKQTQISEKYNDFRKRIGLLNLSDSERLRLLNAAGRDEAKEYRDAFMSVFEKTDLFEKAFGNIDALTKKEISQLLPQLEKKMQELIDLGAPTAEVEVFRKKIEDLRTLTSGNSPFKSLIASFKELRKRIREGTATQEDFNRLNQHIQETKFYTDLAVNSAKELSEALGIDGKGGPFEKFAKDLTQTLEGLVNALVGYFSGNIQQMVGGIAQMVVGIIKMLSTAGDGKKEKGIREWKRAVDDLKFAYEELQRTIEKTAGESQIAMQRDLIANLKEQQRILYDMRSKEADKKKADQDKIAGYTEHIKDINVQIQDVIDNFQKSITTTDFKDWSQKIADALIDAFGKGEDAAAAFDKVVDDVMRNAVANALKIKILEPAVKNMVDKLYQSLGFGGESGATAEQAALLKGYQDQIAEIEKKLPTANSLVAANLNSTKNYLLEKIKILQQQIAANSVSGSFDGLTEEEREKIKALGVNAMQQYTAALQQYEDLFGSAAENAQGMKGDIKGITEKTAGALEAQFNAVRINIVAILKIHQANQNVFKNQLNVLSQIEVNTRRLHTIDKTLAEMNAKMKKSLAGVP